MDGRLRIVVKQGQPFQYEEKDKDTLKAILSDALPKGSFEFDQKQSLCIIPESYIGILELPTRTIEIAPAIRNVTMKQVQMMYFFVKAESWDLLEAKSVFDLAQGSVTESIAKKFVQELDQVIQRGLPHLYEYREVDSDFLKGSLDLSKTFENLAFHKSTPFHCNFEETSMNNPVSRILGAALYKIEAILPDDFVRLARNVPYCTAEEGRMLSKKYLALNNKRAYYNALYWAAHVLFDLQVISLGPERMGSSFLIDFYFLFEEFCYKALKVAGESQGLDVSLLVRAPIICYEESDAVERELKTMTPDILYFFDQYSRTAEVVLDSKCKEEQFLAPDIYQVEFYSTCLLARKCFLLYPRGSKVATDPSYRIMKIQSDFKNVHLKEIYAVFVDLSAGSLQEFVSNINHFAGTVAQLVEQKSAA